MGLKRFDYKLPGERKNYKSIVLVLSICMIAVLSFTSYALYQVQDKKDIVNSKVGEFSTSDVSLAILIDGVKSDSFPSKTSGKSFEKIECTNSGKAEWDYDSWKLSIIEISGPTECTVSFKEGENAATKLTNLAKTNTEEMFTDDTEDANIRYMGKDPANYIDIGNGYYSEDLYRGYKSTTNYNYEEYTSLEACQTGVNGTYKTNCTKIYSKGEPILWRVIGVMNNVDDGTGRKETRLKVIREKDIGLFGFSEYCPDAEIGSDGSCTNWYGNNNWETSELKQILNNGYFNQAIVEPYNMLYERDAKAKKVNGDFTKIGISKPARILVQDAVYHLGGPTNSNYNTATTKAYYEIERSEIVYEGNPTTWTGKVGLMYPSDYGYATSGSLTKDKTACAAKELYSWNLAEYADCKNNNWLYDNAYSQWMITPTSYSQSSLMSIWTGGSVNSPPETYFGYVIRPVLYLKSDVKIISGSGSKSDPYKLGA